MTTPSLLKRLFRATALLRRYKASQSQRFPWFIRFGFNRTRIRKEAHRQWSGGYVFVDDGGLVYLPGPLELMSGHLLLQENKPNRFLQALVKEGDVFLDIGANLGEWARCAAPVVGKSGKVLAFEPIPHVARAIRKTVLANRLGNVRVFEVAVSAADGEATFSIERENSGGSRLGSLEDDKTQIYSHLRHFEHIRVVTRSLDSIVTETGLTQIDVMKIDVEGNELGVLQGASDCLARFKPVLFMETGQEDAASRAEIHRILASHGYTILGVALGSEYGMADATWDEYLNHSGVFTVGITDMLLAVGEA